MRWILYLVAGLLVATLGLGAQNGIELRGQPQRERNRTGRRLLRGRAGHRAHGPSRVAAAPVAEGARRPDGPIVVEPPVRNSRARTSAAVLSVPGRRREPLQLPDDDFDEIVRRRGAGGQPDAHGAGRGSQSAVTISPFRATERWRISARRDQAVRIGDVVGRDLLGANPAPGCRCCCCCSRRSPASGRSARSASNWTTASCRSCVALQMVSKARKRVRELGLAVALAHRLAEHLADLDRFGAEHRRLVRAPDALPGATSGSNPGEMASAKRVEKCGALRRIGAGATSRM